MTFLQNYILTLGALYGPLILYMLAASVHRTVVNVLKGNINLNSLLFGQYL
jgi:hypothetical protein